MGEQVCNSEEMRERAAAGDLSLLEDLFNCYRDDLIGFLRQRCGDQADADDAVQDAFVAAARYLDSFRGEAQLKTWLYKLASSACTRMRRGRKNDPNIHVDVADTSSDSLASSGDRLEQVVEARLKPLQRAINQLKPLDRSVLMLRDGEGMSTREVADQLELSESAVKSRLHRSRRTLKEILSENE